MGASPHVKRAMASAGLPISLGMNGTERGSLSSLDSASTPCRRSWLLILRWQSLSIVPGATASGDILSVRRSAPSQLESALGFRRCALSFQAYRATQSAQMGPPFFLQGPSRALLGRSFSFRGLSRARTVGGGLQARDSLSASLSGGPYMKPSSPFQSGLSAPFKERVEAGSRCCSKRSLSSSRGGESWRSTARFLGSHAAPLSIR